MHAHYTSRRSFCCPPTFAVCTLCIKSWCPAKFFLFPPEIRGDKAADPTQKGPKKIMR